MPPRLKARHIWQAALVALIGVGLTVLVFHGTWRDQNERDTLTTLADWRAADLSSKLSDTADFGAGMAVLFSIGLELGQENFERFATTRADDETVMPRGIAWAPRVLEKEREAFQNRARFDIRPDCRIVDRAVPDAPPVAMMSLDRGGLVATWNGTAETLTGRAAGDTIGRPLPFGDRHDGNDIEDIMAQALAGHSALGVELFGRHRDGSRLTLLLAAAPVRGEDGAVTGVMVVALDIGPLTGGLAHDLNNIFGVVIGNLDLVHLKLKDRPAESVLLENAMAAIPGNRDHGFALINKPYRAVELAAELRRLLGEEGVSA